MTEMPLVERRFELDGGELVVRFFSSLKAPGDEFQCRDFIGWQNGEECRYAYGLDTLQALMLAMRTVHIELSRVMHIGVTTFLGAIRAMSTFRPLGVRDPYMTRLHSHKPFNQSRLDSDPGLA